MLESKENLNEVAEVKTRTKRQDTFDLWSEEYQPELKQQSDSEFSPLKDCVLSNQIKKESKLPELIQPSFLKNEVNAPNLKREKNTSRSKLRENTESSRIKIKQK